VSVSRHSLSLLLILSVTEASNLAFVSAVRTMYRNALEPAIPRPSSQARPVI